MSIRIDRSGSTCLAVCCCGWRGTTTTLDAVARRQAVAHEIAQHPGDHHARRASRRAHSRRGHAGDSGNVTTLT